MTTLSATTADTLRVIEDFAAAFDAKDIDRIMSHMADDCVFESTSPPDGERHVGHNAVRAAWQRLFADAAHARFTTESRFVYGDRAVVLWRYDWGDGHVRGVDILLVRDGLVAEKLSYVKG